MNDADDELERELVALRPARLSPGARARLASSMSREVTSGRRPAWRRPALLALAAALLIAALVAVGVRGRPVGGTPAAAMPRASYQPHACGRILVACEDLGARLLDGHTPVRELHCRFVDRLEWRDPRTGRTVSATVPRSEVCLVAMQVN